MKFIKFLTIAFTLSMAVHSFSQNCENEYLDTCKRHLSEDHFTFLKSYSLSNLRGEHTKYEYSYMLLSGKKYEYYFEGYREGGQDIIATLYDPKHKAVATSRHHDMFEHRLVFDCRERGIYYIEFTFKDENVFCGTASLGFSSKAD